MHNSAPPLIRTPVYRGEQVRDAERPLLEAGQGDALMRTAAHGLATHVLEVLKQSGRVYGSRVTALVGSGNNGGDALFALAFLRRRGVAAYAVLTRGRAHTEALAQFRSDGGRVVEAVPEGTHLLVDAMVGTGFSGTFRRPEVPGLESALQTAAVIACDLPSGVEADTGRAADATLTAHHTVTFGCLKQGLLVGAGGQLSGRLHVVDIGINAHLPQTPVWAVAEGSKARPAALARQSDQPARRVPALRGPTSFDHKYSRGMLRIYAGSEQFPGAAQLCVGAALSTGIGMVTLAAPEYVRRQVVAAWPEAVGAEPGDVDGVGDAGAIIIGPGIGNDPHRSADAAAVLERAVSQQVRCVLDASGLGLIRDQLRRRHGLGSSVLITPHLGEARRLAEDLRDPVLGSMLASGPKADPVEAARRLSGALDCAVLLKGPTTVIAEPDGDVVLHRAEDQGTPGVPGLATAGTGDVLSGILGAMAATQELDWLTLAGHAVHRHVRAALACEAEGAGTFGASALVQRLGRS